MTNLNEAVHRTAVIATVAGLLLLPLAEESTAQTCSASKPCPSGMTCGPNEQCIANTPEMSDYLAMAFVAVAGGMIYFFRRRAVKAQQTASIDVR